MGTIYKGWNAKIYIATDISDTGTWIEIGCAESVSVDINTNVELYYCIGDRDPYAVVPGNLEITGSMSRVWINCYYLNLLIDDDLPTFQLIFMAKNVATAPWLYLYDCYFETGTIDIPQDGILMEDYDFRATSIFCTADNTPV